MFIEVIKEIKPYLESTFSYSEEILSYLESTEILDETTYILRF